jgi:toxin ParE1/3/4
MQIRWSPEAADDLERIVEFISQENPAAAQRTAQDIYKRVGTLAAFPNLGKAGRVYGTREMPLSPLPFIVVYRVLEEAGTVEIANVIHGAQRWPPSD